MSDRVELSLEDERELAALVLAFPVVDASELFQVLRADLVALKKANNGIPIRHAASWMTAGLFQLEVARESPVPRQIQLAVWGMLTKRHLTFVFTPPEGTELAGAATFRWLRSKLSDLSEGRIKTEDPP